jgi:hypothetical protein
MATKAKIAKAAAKPGVWDPANHLKTEAEIAGYLAEIFEVAGDDPAVVAAAVEPWVSRPLWHFDAGGVERWSGVRV